MTETAEMSSVLLAIVGYVAVVIMLFAAIGWLWILYDALYKPWRQGRRQRARIRRQMRS